MLKQKSFSLEAKIAWAGIAFGLVCAACLTPKDQFFWENFSYFAGSQLGVLFLLVLFNPRPAIIAGAAFAVPVYLLLFKFWMISIKAHEGLEILGYFFSLPGAVIGGAIARFMLGNRFRNKALVSCCLAAGLVTLGLFIGQTTVCNTVMYCSWLTFIKGG